MLLASAVSEVIFVITSAVKDVCGKPPTERVFLDKYGKICLCLDEIVWKVRGIFIINKGNLETTGLLVLHLYSVGKLI